MSDTAKTAQHGRLFDSFSASPSHTHGGSYFDAGFGLQTLHAAHGRLYDLFGAPKDPEYHGEHYDEFGWQPIPAMHGGQLFDTEFRSNVPGEENPHGSTWYDVFRGGRTQARYIFDGQDYEGTVIDVNPEFATVRSQDGQTHEVGLSQFLGYRTPTQQQDSPEIPASDAHAPSARNRVAHGSYHGERDEPGTGRIAQPVSEGPGNTDPRSSVPDGLMGTIEHLKAIAGELDVQKVRIASGPAVHPTALAAGHHISFAHPRSGAHMEGVIHDTGASHVTVHGLKGDKPHAVEVPHSHIRGVRIGPHPTTGVHLYAPVGKTTADQLVDVVKEHLGWDRMVSKLKGEGHSQESAEKISGYIARKKYGPDMNRGKTLDESLEVLKASAAAHAVRDSQEHAPFAGAACPSCGSRDLRDHFNPGGGGALHARCASCGQAAWLKGTGKGHTLLPSLRKVSESLDANKSVDTTETATQSQDLNDDDDGKRAWCPHCQHECKKPTGEGTCPTCGAKVVAKSFGAPADSWPGGQTDTVSRHAESDSGQARREPPDVPVPQREHKSTDHHSDRRKPGRCPHCGAILELNEHQTDQGQAHRQEKQGARAEFDTVTHKRVTHKCVGTGIDTLKTLVEA